MPEKIFRVTQPYRNWRLGHLLIEPGDYTEAELTRHYTGLPDDLIRKERGHWLEGLDVVQSGYPEDVPQQPTGEIPLAKSEDAREVEPNEPLDYEAMSRAELEAFAERIGFDLSTIEGTGANGNVVKADIVQALQSRD